MSTSRKRMTNEAFYRRLNELRAMIDSVPEQYRAALRAGADQAQEQHERMQRTCAWVEDMLADLSLSVEHTKFHVDACRRELAALDPAGRFPM